MFEYCNCFVVKTTRDCNLRCKYCYVADKDKYKGEIMPFDVFKKLVNRICFEKNYRKIEDIHRENGEDFSFVFHGGEPTIIGFENLSKYLSYAANSFEFNGLKASLGVQTNATLLTEDLCALFHDYDVHVGLSIDGAIEANKLRNTFDYSKTFQLLRDYGVDFGSLTVVSKQNIDRIQESLEFLKENRIYSGKFNFAEDLWNFGDVEVPGEDFLNKCMIPLYEEAEKKIISLEKEGNAVEIAIFADSHVTHMLDDWFKFNLTTSDMKNLRNLNVRGNCHITFCGAGKEVVEISPDGTINFCGRYSGDTETSTISSLDIPDFLGTVTRKNLYKHVYDKHRFLTENHCDICLAKDICDKGCYAFTYEKFGKLQLQKNLICNFYIPYKKWLIRNEGRLWNIQFGLKQQDFTFYQKTRVHTSSKAEINSFMREKERYLNTIQSKFLYTVEIDSNFSSDNPEIIQLKITNKTLQDKFKK